MSKDYLCFKTGQFKIQKTLSAFALFVKTLKEDGFTNGRIIELGTGRGGFSVFLALYCIFLGKEWKLYTFDNGNRLQKHSQIALLKLGASFFNTDIFGEEATKEIIELIQSEGTTVLLCDNGHKRREFNLFSKYLKSGDYIFAHDLKIEIREKDVEEACEKYDIVPHMQKTFEEVRWLSKKKT